MSLSPLDLTVNPRLDAALREGGFAWEEAAREEGVKRTVSWLRNRLSEDAKHHDISDTVAALLEAEDEDGRVFARIDLAELLETEDDAVADALWEATLAHGLAAEDPDLIFEATSHLAAIAEDNGDPLAAAEYYVDFLNWRRNPDRGCDPEHVEQAFDHVIRLAEADGEPKIAAEFTFRQVEYTRLANAEDERAFAGDWESSSDPYQSWG